MRRKRKKHLQLGIIQQNRCEDNDVHAAFVHYQQAKYASLLSSTKISIFFFFWAPSLLDLNCRIATELIQPTWDVAVQWQTLQSLQKSVTRLRLLLKTVTRLGLIIFLSVYLLGFPYWALSIRNETFKYLMQRWEVSLWYLVQLPYTVHWETCLPLYSNPNSSCSAENCPVLSDFLPSGIYVSYSGL